MSVGKKIVSVVHLQQSEPPEATHPMSYISPFMWRDEPNPQPIMDMCLGINSAECYPDIKMGVFLSATMYYVQASLGPCLLLYPSDYTEVKSIVILCLNPSELTPDHMAEAVEKIKNDLSIDTIDAGPLSEESRLYTCGIKTEKQQTIVITALDRTPREKLGDSYYYLRSEDDVYCMSVRGPVSFSDYSAFYGLVYKPEWLNETYISDDLCVLNDARVNKNHQNIPYPFSVNNMVMTCVNNYLFQLQKGAGRLIVFQDLKSKVSRSEIFNPIAIPFIVAEAQQAVFSGQSLKPYIEMLHIIRNLDQDTLPPCSWQMNVEGLTAVASEAYSDIEEAFPPLENALKKQAFLVQQQSAEALFRCANHVVNGFVQVANFDPVAKHYLNVLDREVGFFFKRNSLPNPFELYPMRHAYVRDDLIGLEIRMQHVFMLLLQSSHEMLSSDVLQEKEKEALIQILILGLTHCTGVSKNHPALEMLSNAKSPSFYSVMLATQCVIKFADPLLNPKLIFLQEQCEFLLDAYEFWQQQKAAHAQKMNEQVASLKLLENSLKKDDVSVNVVDSAKMRGDESPSRNSETGSLVLAEESPPRNKGRQRQGQRKAPVSKVDSHERQGDESSSGESEADVVWDEKPPSSDKHRQRQASVSEADRHEEHQQRQAFFSGMGGPGLDYDSLTYGSNSDNSSYSGATKRHLPTKTSDPQRQAPASEGDMPGLDYNKITYGGPSDMHSYAGVTKRYVPTKISYPKKQAPVQAARSKPGPIVLTGTFEDKCERLKQESDLVADEGRKLLHANISGQYDDDYVSRLNQDKVKRGKDLRRAAVKVVNAYLQESLNTLGLMPPDRRFFRIFDLCESILKLPFSRKLYAFKHIEQCQEFINKCDQVKDFLNQLDGVPGGFRHDFGKLNDVLRYVKTQMQDIEKGLDVQAFYKDERAQCLRQFSVIFKGQGKMESVGDLSRCVEQMDARLLTTKNLQPIERLRTSIKSYVSNVGKDISGHSQLVTLKDVLSQFLNKVRVARNSVEETLAVISTNMKSLKDNLPSKVKSKKAYQCYVFANYNPKNISAWCKSIEDNIQASRSMINQLWLVFGSDEKTNELRSLTEQLDAYEKAFQVLIDENTKVETLQGAMSDIICGAHKVKDLNIDSESKETLVRWRKKINAWLTQSTTLESHSYYSFVQQGVRMQALRNSIQLLKAKQARIQSAIDNTCEIAEQTPEEQCTEHITELADVVGSLKGRSLCFESSKATDSMGVRLKKVDALSRLYLALKPLTSRIQQILEFSIEHESSLVSEAKESFKIKAGFDFSTLSGLRSEDALIDWLVRELDACWLGPFQAKTAPFKDTLETSSLPWVVNIKTGDESVSHDLILDDVLSDIPPSTALPIIRFYANNIFQNRLPMSESFSQVTNLFLHHPVKKTMVSLGKWSLGDQFDLLFQLLLMSSHPDQERNAMVYIKRCIEKNSQALNTLRGVDAMHRICVYITCLKPEHQIALDLPLISIISNHSKAFRKNTPYSDLILHLNSILLLESLSQFSNQHKRVVLNEAYTRLSQRFSLNKEKESVSEDLCMAEVIAYCRLLHGVRNDVGIEDIEYKINSMMRASEPSFVFALIHNFIGSWFHKSARNIGRVSTAGTANWCTQYLEGLVLLTTRKDPILTLTHEENDRRFVKSCAFAQTNTYITNNYETMRGQFHQELDFGFDRFYLVSEPGIVKFSDTLDLIKHRFNLSASTANAGNFSSVVISVSSLKRYILTSLPNVNNAMLRSSAEMSRLLLMFNKTVSLLKDLANTRQNTKFSIYHESIYMLVYTLAKYLYLHVSLAPNAESSDFASASDFLNLNTTALKMPADNIVSMSKIMCGVVRKDTQALSELEVRMDAVFWTVQKPTGPTKEVDELTDACVKRLTEEMGLPGKKLYRMLDLAILANVPPPSDAYRSQDSTALSSFLRILYGGAEKPIRYKEGNKTVEVYLWNKEGKGDTAIKPRLPNTPPFITALWKAIITDVDWGREEPLSKGLMRQVDPEAAEKMASMVEVSESECEQDVKATFLRDVETHPDAAFQQLALSLKSLAQTESYVELTDFVREFIVQKCKEATLSLHDLIRCIDRQSDSFLKDIMENIITPRCIIEVLEYYGDKCTSLSSEDIDTIIEGQIQPIIEGVRKNSLLSFSFYVSYKPMYMDFLRNYVPFLASKSRKMLAFLAELETDIPGVTQECQLSANIQGMPSLFVLEHKEMDEAYRLYLETDSTDSKVMTSIKRKLKEAHHEGICYLAEKMEALCDQDNVYEGPPLDIFLEAIFRYQATSGKKIPGKVLSKLYVSVSLDIMKLDCKRVENKKRISVLLGLVKPGVFQASDQVVDEENRGVQKEVLSLCATHLERLAVDDSMQDSQHLFLFEKLAAEFSQRVSEEPDVLFDTTVMFMKQFSACMPIGAVCLNAFKMMPTLLCHVLMKVPFEDLRTALDEEGSSLDPILLFILQQTLDADSDRRSSNYLKKFVAKIQKGIQEKDKGLPGIYYFFALACADRNRDVFEKK